MLMSTKGKAVKVKAGKSHANTGLTPGLFEVVKVRG